MTDPDLPAAIREAIEREAEYECSALRGRELTREWLLEYTERIARLTLEGQIAIKRYLVFASDDYYPSGGWGDFVGAFDEIDEARAAERKAEHDGKSSHVVDMWALAEV